jgi:hypothetical protein
LRFRRYAKPQERPVSGAQRRGSPDSQAMPGPPASASFGGSGVDLAK